MDEKQKSILITDDGYEAAEDVLQVCSIWKPLECEILKSILITDDGYEPAEDLLQVSGVGCHQHAGNCSTWHAKALTSMHRRCDRGCGAQQTTSAARQTLITCFMT